MILIVDDDGQLTGTLECVIEERVGQPVAVASNVETALNLVRSTEIDLLILAYHLRKNDEADLLDTIFATAEPPAVLLTSTHLSSDLVLSATLPGVLDYMQKPFDPTDMVARINRILPARALERKRGTDPFPLLIGASGPIRQMKKMITKLAGTAVTVLVTGETGTGKELIARALHTASPRGDKPFVPVDCGALPASVVESELFGHEAGSFTGAHRDHLGLFRSADTGTIFLDEVSELTMELQTRLLRVLQERTVRPVGAVRSEKVDVRVIAASNKDLHQAVKDGTFRQDLLYRLNSVVVHAPPLRNHLDDIDILVDHFVQVALMENPSLGKKVFREAALEEMKKHDWPGNVRELRNFVVGTMVLSDSTIITGAMVKKRMKQMAREASLPVSTSDETGWRSAKDIAIDQALAQTNGNKKEAAKLLGIAESTIHRNLKRRQKE